MKAVLISVKPKWVEKIANGEKTIEVRKTRPKIETPFKCYIYCTQGKIKDLMSYNDWIYQNRMRVIGEFSCDDIDTVRVFNDILYCEKNSQANKLGQMCLTIEEVKAYLGENNGYNWHISDLKIYDKPRELKEFSKYGFGRFVEVKRPPMSWQFVEVE
jgi:predicted transcriptional regulator